MVGVDRCVVRENTDLGVFCLWQKLQPPLVGRTDVWSEKTLTLECFAFGKNSNRLGNKDIVSQKHFKRTH